MKKALFISGNQIIKKHKTGVQNVHANLLLEYLKIGDCSIGLFNFRNKFDVDLYSYCDSDLKSHIIQNTMIPERLKYYLPIELFFGKYKYYICDGFIPLHLKSSKIIAIVHDLMPLKYPEYYTADQIRYFSKFYFNLKKVDKILAVSESTKNDINELLGIDKSKILVSYPSTSFISEKELPKNNLISPNIKYFIYIGALRKNKNLINAIKGFKEFSKNNKGYYFYIAGSKNNEYENLKKYVEENNLSNSVVFLGFINDEDKFTLYKKSQALLFVSKYEGFGIPIIEAMKAGTPVVTSNVSSMKEIARDDAVLVDPNNPYDISKGLVKALENKEYYIEKGYKRVEDFKWEKMAKDLYEIINDFK